jgi:hypothetical protein
MYLFESDKSRLEENKNQRKTFPWMERIVGRAENTCRSSHVFSCYKIVHRERGYFFYMYNSVLSNFDEASVREAIT